MRLLLLKIYNIGANWCYTVTDDKFMMQLMMVFLSLLLLMIMTMWIMNSVTAVVGADDDVAVVNDNAAADVAYADDNDLGVAKIMVM